MIDFIATHELAILRWLHILCMVYWLGGEWGIFQTAYKATNPKISADERGRHMDTIFRIDVLSRTGIVSLLPLGLHMGHLWGVQPYGGAWLGLFWGLWVIWVTITLLSFFGRGKPRQDLYKKMEDWTRYTLIPILLIVPVTSLMGYGPFEAGEGQKWFSLKIGLLGLLFVIGVCLRIILYGWMKYLAVLAVGPNKQAELDFARSVRKGRFTALIYWTGIALAGFLGAVKPF